MEFAKLREDTEKKNMAVKAAGERKAPREEMCKMFSGFSAAMVKWAKYTEVNSTSCGIPPQIVDQLKKNKTQIEQVREKICSGGGGGAGAPPTLSEVLGTTHMAAPEAGKGSGGVMDTLTGTLHR